ncbi:MAG: WecB/TagA/CpsF family glycosyltransferase [Pseudomonadota bacterium]|nr:WecB/TagA/CpsF family glycosyltransferase [Pseudomonadota bacterium]
MKKETIIKSNITVGSYSEFIDSVISLSQEKPSSYVCICNVHMLIEANDSQEFSEVVNNADMVSPDGKPVAKGLEWLYGIKQPRIAGMDLIESLFECITKGKLSVYLFGSTEEVLTKMVAKATAQFPGIIIVGFLSPPFRELSGQEKNEIVEKINEHNPDFVFVALGCPKQERWMAEHKDKVNSCMIGLGGAFPVYAEAVARSPYWMQRNGLEWLYRLYKEPGRLWKRYFYTNSKFLWLFGLQIIKNKLHLRK